MKYIFLALSLVSVLISNAQQQELVKLQPDENTGVLIAAKFTNHFYREVDNPLSIHVGDVNADQLFVATSNGTIAQSANGYVVSNITKNSILIGVYQINQLDTALLYDRKFKVLPIPSPTPYVAGKTGYATVDIALLKASNKVNAHLENFDFSLRFQVEQYTVTIPECGEGTFSEKVTGDDFSAEFKSKLNALQSGDLVIFDTIAVLMPNKELRVLSPVVLKMD